MALKVGELFASFNIDTSGVTKAMDSAEKKMRSFGGGLALAGAGMTAALTVPVKQAATAIYEAGTSFDSQMSKVFAIIGKEATGNADVMEALNKKALEMGSTTQFTASEAGEAMEYMAMAGWKSGEMLAAIEPLMNLAAAAGEDLGTTSDIVTDAMTAFGLAADGTSKVLKNGVTKEVNNVAHFADVLAAASSNSNTNVAMMGESFKYVAPIAGSMGYTIEETAIALGILANSGIKSSQAGTSLRRIFTSLNGKIDISGKKLGKVTISTTKADGSMRSLTDILADCRKAFSQLSDSEKTAAAKNLVGQNAMSAFLTLMNVTEKDLGDLTNAIYGADGAAEDMKRTMLDNAQGDVTILKSAIEGLEITLWDLAEDGFRKVVQDATGVVDALRNMDEGTQLGIIGMGGLAAAAGPFTAAVGGLISSLPSLTTLFTALTGPTALMALSFLALGAAAIDADNNIGTTFVKAMEKAGKKVEEFGAKVAEQEPVISERMGNFLDSVAKGIEEGVPGIMDGIGDVLTTAITAISKNMGRAANVSRTLVMKIAGGVRDNAPKIIPAIVNLMSEMAQALITNIPTVVSATSEVLTAVAKALADIDWAQVGTDLHDAIQTALKDLGTWFRQLAMGDEYKEDASWQEVGAAMIKNIIAGIKTGFGALRDFVGGLLLGDQYVKEDDFATFGGKLIDAIFAGAEGTATGAADFVGGIMTGISDMFTPTAVAGEALNIVKKIVDAIGDNLKKLKENGAGESLGGSVAKILDAIFDGIASLGTDTHITGFIEDIGQGLMDAMGSLGAIVGDFAGKLLGYLFSEDGLRSIYSAGSAVIQLLYKGIEAAVGSIGDFIGNFVDRILIQLGVVDPEAREKAKEAGTELVATIQTGMEEGFGGNNLMQSLMEWTLFRGGEGFSLGTESTITNDLLASLNDAFSNAAKAANGDAAEFKRQLIQAFIYNSDIERLLNGGELRDELFTEEEIAALLPKGEDFWSNFLKAYTEGDFTTLMQLMNESGMSLLGLAKPAVEDTAEALQKAEDQAVSEFTSGMSTSAKEAVESVQKEAAGVEQAVEAAQAGIEAATEKKRTYSIKWVGDSNTAEATGQDAKEIADAITEPFIITINKEGGEEIGGLFISGLITKLNDGTLVATMTTLGNDARNAIANILTSDAGYSIGSAFGSSIAAGIADALAMSGVNDLSHGLSGAAANNMSMPGMAGGGANTQAQSIINSMPTPAQLGAAVANALNGTQVAMDGQAVGYLVAPTVSNYIANESYERV